MRKLFSVMIIILITGIFIYVSAGEEHQDIKNLDLNPNAQSLQPAGKPTLELNFGKIPLYFIANQGQVNAKAKFYAKASRYTLWLTKEGLVFDSTIKEKLKIKKEKVENLKLKTQNSKLKTKIKRDISRLIFLGANKNPEVIPLNESKLRVNYFKGNDRSKWVGNIPTAQAVLYKNLYKNIDLKVYGIEKQIEYDWIVRPGGNPEDIRFEYKNVKKTNIDKDGNLVIKTKFGELAHRKPMSYQVNDELRGREDERARGSEDHEEKNSKFKTQNSKFEGLKQKQTINVAFRKINKNTYGFEVGEYDKSQHLIIDPLVLVYSTYLGGSGSDTSAEIAVDTNGFAYICGVTGSTDFPTLNQYMSDPGDGDQDVTVTKIDTTQSGAASLIYSTYMGGSDWEIVVGIAVDNSNNAYVTGFSLSTDFPCLNAYQSSLNGFQDAFVFKLDTSQSGTSCLKYSTYLGGSSSDSGISIAVDSSGNAYVTGSTSSTDFPILNQYQTDQTSSDVFVTKLNPTQSGASSLLYSTYLGGDGYENARGIVLDSTGYVYVMGSTKSTDFPTLNQYQLDPVDDEYDVFVSKLDTSQSGASCLLYSTYLGGSGEDKGQSLAVNNSGIAYLTGYTKSTDFPTLNQYQLDPGDNDDDIFVSSINTTSKGNPCLLYSTYIGGNGADLSSNIVLDPQGYVYVMGVTSSSNFPTLNPYQATHAGGTDDACLFRLNTTSSGILSLLYSTYLGGNDDDSSSGIALDSSGNVYLSGFTKSTDFPTVNQYQLDPSDSDWDAFVSKFAWPSIKATSPDGGEDWTLNTTHNITWDAVGLSNNIYILLKQNGVKVALIAKNLNPSLGTYSWTVGNCRIGTVIANANCKILIREMNSNVKDESDAPFTISNPYITITTPAGGEDWQIGTTENITWHSAGLSNPIYIILQQNGVSVALIEKNIDPSLGSYSWAVGNCRKGTAAAGSNYQIVIKEQGTTVKDKSNGQFDISN